MSDTSAFGFGRFVPGFDFLQNLAKGPTSGMPGLPGWVAPTASVQELDKRIQELKAVQFWLEQNARALTATVQALEVQKMTLATLAGMNVAVGDMAAAFSSMGAAAQPAAAAAPQPGQAPGAPAQGGDGKVGAGPHAPQQTQPLGMADPLQWWGSLTQQFQQIASHALQDAATQQAAFDATRDMASGALKTASDMAAQWTQGAAAAQPPAKRPAAGGAQQQPPAPAPAPQPAKAGARARTPK